MIVFESDLTKYIKDQEFYNLEFLNYNKKGWTSFYKSYDRKNPKRPDKIQEKIDCMNKASHQLDIINELIFQLPQN